MTVRAESGPKPAGIYARAHRAVVAEAGSLRLLEFFIGCLIAFVGTSAPGLPGNLPLSYVAVLLGLGIAFLRRPRHAFPSDVRWWTLALALGLAAAVVVSVVAGYASTGEWLRRIFRLGIVVAFALVLGSGRLHFRSVLRGFITMLLVNVPLFYLGLTSDTYGGYLTGIFGDKNQAGLNYAVGAVLALLAFGQRRLGIAIFVVLGVPLWLTGSRISLAAYAVAVLWMLFSRRVSLPIKIIVGAVLGWLVANVEENFARVGVFSDRRGTDALRDRIDAASLLKLQDSPWYGRGLGQATVEMENRTWFFHNGYWQLQIEGGIVLLLAVLGFTLFVGTRILRAGATSTERVITQAATIVVLVCAWKLGDVFLTASWALVMGAGIRAAIRDDGIGQTTAGSLAAATRR
ncbi:O-antigen ligase family protein [Kocuria massiliensis]|uniref:O-antigen ligase family protein n=1 Tax=Kocuria massiliensis TaxID=1926282 RepID=UPI0022B9583B|nr:ABC transporter permease [Kocuria massiliensis]